MDSSDFWRKYKIPFTVDPVQGHHRPKKVSIKRPKTAASTLYPQDPSRHMPSKAELAGNKQNTSAKEITKTKQIRVNVIVNKYDTKKEGAPLDIHSKVFKLAHGLIKTPSRSFQGDVSEKSTSCSESDEETSTLGNSHRLNKRNSGYLSSMDMYNEARKTSRGSEETTALFRLAIERQRRLSVAPNDYSVWGSKVGSSAGDGDRFISRPKSGKDFKAKLPEVGKSNNSRNVQINHDHNTNEKHSIIRSVQRCADLAQLNNDYSSGFTGNKKKKITIVKGAVLDVSLVQSTEGNTPGSLILAGKKFDNRKIITNEERKPGQLDNDVGGPKPENEKTFTTLDKEVGKASQTEMTNNDDVQQETEEKSRKVGAPKIDPKNVPLANSSTEALCQNVSTLNELKKIRKEASISSSSDEEESDEETERSKEDDTKGNNDEDKNMKEELEMIHRRLLVSSYDTKKFTLKSYVKPHLRYKTERMYLLRRRNLLHRQIALAAQDSPGCKTVLPWRDQRFGLQVSCFI